MRQQQATGVDIFTGGSRVACEIDQKVGFAAIARRLGAIIRRCCAAVSLVL